MARSPSSSWIPNKQQLPPVMQTKLKVCRVCLAVDVNMYDMKEFKLAQMFHNVTGISACSKEDSTLHRICWECAARLAAAAAFRDKALFSDALLKDLTNIQLSDITSIRETYCSLKSPLTIQTVFTASDIQCSDSMSVKNEEETLVNDDLDLITSDTETRNTEEDFDGPWIEAPIKTETETDPIADNKEADTNDMPIRTHSENTEVEEDNINGTVTREAEVYEVPKINDTDVVLEDREEKPRLDETDDVMDERHSSRSGEDIADELSVDEDENNMSSEVGTARKGNTDYTRNARNELRQRIIALKEDGVPTRRVAALLNIARNTVRLWWRRWSKEGHVKGLKPGGARKKTNPEQVQRLIERVTQDCAVHTPSLAKELGMSTASVVRRLKEAGFSRKRKIASVPLRSGRNHVVADDTKQQIVLMKLNGVSVTDIANQFRVTRTSVYRWCREANTSTEDHSVSDDSEVKQSRQAPILSSYKSKWEKLPNLELAAVEEPNMARRGKSCAPT